MSLKSYQSFEQMVCETQFDFKILHHQNKRID